MTVRELDSKLSEYKSKRKSEIKSIQSRFKRFWAWVGYFFTITWKWLFLTLRDWKSWLIFIACITVTGSTVWVGYLLYWIFRWAWALAMATGSLVFWNCVPCTPFIAINLFLTLGVKRLFEAIREKRKNA